MRYVTLNFFFAVSYNAFYVRISSILLKIFKAQKYNKKEHHTSCSLFSFRFPMT